MYLLEKVKACLDGPLLGMLQQEKLRFYFQVLQKILFHTSTSYATHSHPDTAKKTRKT
jgi:hypothetical protein